MNRLKLLREEKQLTQSDLAKLLGITIPAYSYYENGKRDMSPTTIIKLANYFGVSTDYLLGLTSFKEPKEELEKELYKLDLTEEDLDLAINDVFHYYDNPENVINPINSQQFKTEKEKLAFCTIQFVIANFFGNKIDSELSDDFDLFLPHTDEEKQKLLEIQSYVKDKILDITNSLDKSRIIHIRDMNNFNKYIKNKNKEKTDELGYPVVSIDVLGTIKAGYDWIANEEKIDTIDIDKKLAETGDFFALKIKGTSMEPIFFEGDIVVIRKQNDCETNEVAVVIINGDEGTLKRVKKTDEGIILQPFNSAYGPVMYTNKEIKETPIIIAGVFQELRRTEIKF